MRVGVSSGGSGEGAGRRRRGGGKELRVFSVGEGVVFLCKGGIDAVGWGQDGW